MLKRITSLLAAVWHLVSGLRTRFRGNPVARPPRSLSELLHRIGSGIVDLLVTLASMITVVFKRLRHNLGLSVSAVLGIVAVLGMVVCVPIFSSAVSGEVLRTQLAEKSTNTHRALFSLHMYYQDTRSAGQGITLDQSQIITRFIQENAQRLVGPKLAQLIYAAETTPIVWDPENLKIKRSKNDPWISMSFFTLEGLPQNADLVEGQWPKTTPNGPVQVIVQEKTADKYFMNVGDKMKSGGMEVQIVGIWTAKNLNTTYWFEYPETSYAEKFWIPLETYKVRINPVMDHPIFYQSWYLIFDERSLSFDQSSAYARGMIRMDGELRRLLPGITTDYTPLEALTTYQARATALTTLFYAVGGPMAVLALLFIALTASIAVQQYEQETATMRGRGTSWLQVVTLNLTESVVLVIISLPLALLVGWLEAILMGSTLSFLKFTYRDNLSFSLQGLNLSWLAIGAFFILLARFLPVLGLARISIVRMKQEQSRGSRKSLWERFYLDFLLLIPGVYAYVTLSGIAKPAKILEPLTTPRDGQQYQDPLLFVAPALFAMALCMIVIRLLPLIMRLLAVLFDRLPGVWAYLSLQQIARRPQDHSSALLLIMISLSLSIFSASTAKTLDQWQYDSLYYKSGADLVVHEYVLKGGQQTAYGTGGTSATTISELDLNVDSYINLEEHMKLPSVQAVTRVGKYDGKFSYGVGEQEAIVMGIDRLDFPKVAFYREDFAGQGLGTLMNALGAEPNGLLVPKALADKLGLRAGDNLNVSINALGQSFDKVMVVVGTYTYFPTVYPGTTTTLIANLDTLFENGDAAIGYDIWMKIRKNTDTKLLLYQIRNLIDSDKAVVRVNGDAFDELKTAMDKPERMGLFGVLNVGFIATGLMPGIGFVLYSYASLRRRFIQLGILQAIGLSVAQLIGYLALEQFLLMGLAIGLGAAIGLVTSNLFVPFLQITGASGAPVPPFEVLIGWAESAWLSLAFALILFITVLGTIWYLAQIKVFQAVKMGETL